MIDQPYPGPSQDVDGDGIIDGIASYIQHQQLPPADKKRRWVEENVWKRGLTVDEETGEIVDPNSGQAVGRLPNFS